MGEIGKRGWSWFLSELTKKSKNPKNAPFATSFFGLWGVKVILWQGALGLEGRSQ